jgi:diketogulonate reductase-like aldo/keto reductase
VSKVWNDAVEAGREGVRERVMKSLADLNFGVYFDLYYIHWPVPGHYVEAYHELESIYKEGKIRAIGQSNFGPTEHEQLVHSGI